MSLDAAVANSGISRSSWQRLESSYLATPRPSTALKVEKVLGWAHGSVRAIIDGGEPVTSDWKGWDHKPDASYRDDVGNLVLVEVKAVGSLADARRQLELYAQQLDGEAVLALIAVAERMVTRSSGR